MNLNYLAQRQDSTTLKISTGEPAATLGISRQTIDLSEVRTLTVDSAKLVKVEIPIVKTIPFIPQNDTISHPSYNLFTKNFDFPVKPTLFDQFLFLPFDPTRQERTTGKKLVVDQTTPDTLSLQKEDLLIKKIEASKRVPKGKGFEATDWMLGVILASLLLFGWIRVGYGKYVQIAMQASYNFFTARRIKEEANILRTRVFYFLNLLFFLNLSLFITQGLDYFQVSVPFVSGISLYFVIFGGLVIVYSLKTMLLFILDFIFLAKGAFNYYNSTVFIYNRMVGLFLLPVITVLPFISNKVTPWLFYSGFLVFVFFYLFRIFRGLQIGFKNRLSIFYLILYLCALEILPVWVLYHWAQSQ